MEARLIKVTLLGGPSSGKTALASKYAYDEFHERYQPTTGVKLYNKLFRRGEERRGEDRPGRELDIWFELWEIAGSNRDQPKHTKDAQAIFIVCDMTKDKWEEEFQSVWQTYFMHIRKDAVIFIVGTKKDLIDEKLLKERELTLRNFFANNKMLAEIHPELANREVYFATTSAKTGEGIKNLFVRVLNRFHTIISFDQNSDEDSAELDQPQQGENAPQASLATIMALAEKIDAISGDNAFWKTKVGSYARNQGKTSPDGVNQIHAENTIKNLTARLQKISKDAKFKRSSTSLAEWFHSYFRSRHPATEEFYGILSKLDNFSENTVGLVTNKLAAFQEKYRPATNEKKKELSILIHDILSQGNQDHHPMQEKFSHAGVKEILNLEGSLEAAYSAAEKNHSSFPRLHFFSNQIPDPKLNELYGILKELKELDNATVDKVTRKLHKFKLDMVKISHDDTLRV